MSYRRDDRDRGPRFQRDYRGGEPQRFTPSDEGFDDYQGRGGWGFDDYSQGGGMGSGRMGPQGPGQYGGQYGPGQYGQRGQGDYRRERGGEFRTSQYGPPPADDRYEQEFGPRRPPYGQSMYGPQQGYGGGQRYGQPQYPGGGLQRYDRGQQYYGASEGYGGFEPERRDWSDTGFGRGHTARDFGSEGPYRGALGYGDRPAYSYESRGYEGRERIPAWDQHPWNVRGQHEEHPGLLRRIFGMGKGPKGYKRSDERIREDIHERLFQDDYIDSREVSVEVSNGVVTLTGTVPERRMKHAIEDLVEHVYGVQDIDNRIRVQRASEMGQPAAGAQGTTGEMFGYGTSSSTGMRGGRSDTSKH